MLVVYIQGDDLDRYAVNDDFSRQKKLVDYGENVVLLLFNQKE